MTTRIRYHVALTVLVSILAVPMTVHAVTLGLSIGPVKAVGDGSESVRTGVAPGVSGFVGVTQALALGVRARYTYFPLDFDDTDTIGSGSTDILDVVPYLRYQTARARGANAFGRVGVGVYRVHSSFKIESSNPAVNDQMNAKGSETKAGFSFGGGVILGHGGTRLEVGPFFDVAFTDGTSTKYVVLAVAVTFGGTP
jgi:hypothetical protein